MTFDAKAIGNAIASRYSSVTPPAGESAIAFATASLPDEITNEPALIVYPPLPGSFSFGPGVRKGVIEFPVRFFLYKTGNAKRNSDLLLSWASVLYSQVAGQIQLGLSSYVTWAEVNGFPALGKIKYSDTEFYGVEFVVGVHVWEAVAAVA